MVGRQQADAETRAVSTNSDNPLLLLRADRQRAREQQDPCANLCTLADVDAQGLPQSRTLVLRDIGERFGVFINTTSPKWPSVSAGPVAVVVWLPSVQVQYRLNCGTEPIATELVAQSWHLRPDAPKKMDWLYTQEAAQSTPIGKRQDLLDAVDALTLPEPLTAPHTARGVYLLPSQVERLYLGESNGIHDRQRYTLKPDSEAWSRTTLIP